MVGAFYLRLRRSRLPAPASRFHVTTSVKLFTHVPLSPGSIIWYRGQGGPGAVLVWRRTGHASQTSVVHPPAGSREMSTPPALLMGYGTVYTQLHAMD